MAATEQSKVLFAALYAREYNKFQEFAKSLRRPPGFPPGPVPASVDDPQGQSLPWNEYAAGTVSLPNGEQSWIAIKAFQSAQTALYELQTWAEQQAVAAETADPPDTGLRGYYSDFVGISETSP